MVKINDGAVILSGMRGDMPVPQIDDSDGTWSDLETLVDDTAKLAQKLMASRDFHGQLLQRLMQATDACAAAIWSRERDDSFAIQTQVTPPQQLPADAEQLACRSQNVALVADSRHPSAVPPRQIVGQLRNPLDSTLLLQPVVVEGLSVAVIETFHHPDVSISPTESRNTAELVTVFAELAAEFHRNRQLRELRHRESAWAELEPFVEQVHRSLDLQHTAFVIANEAARVTACDRVMVFGSRDACCRLLAITGLDTFDRRSEHVRAAERFVQAVAAIAEPFWYRGDAEPLPAPLEERLQAYLNLSHFRSLAVLPLGRNADAQPDGSAGVLLFERFDGSDWDDSQRRSIAMVGRHAATALQHARDVSDLPFIGASRALQRCRRMFGSRQWSTAAAVLTLAAAAVAALVFVRADFVIRGEGELVPVHYRHLFAPADGVIERIHVQHAESVKAGAPLLEMRSSELEFEDARLLGEILTSQKQLDAIRAALLNHKATSALPAGELHVLTSDEARLQIQLASLRQQQAILERQRAELAVASPIGGQVLTWGIDEALSQRPVRRGERLLSVADSQGPWGLDLRIADRDIEHVLAAQRAGAPLGVHFILASHSGQRYRGIVQEVAMATELDEQDQPTVLVRVAIDRQQLPELRPGATVIANVDCGRRAIGYVWLREFFDVLKTRLLF